MDSIGVDVGTSVVKAVRFDADFEVQAQAEHIVPVQRPDSVCAEQDADAVVAAVVDVISRVVPEAGHVGSISITAQGDGCWLVDADARPVGPAILWNDARATAIVEEWEASGTLDSAFQITGSYGNASLPSAILAWMKQHDPQRLARGRHVLTCGSWVHLALTGRAVLDVSEACNPFLDAQALDYSARVLELYGLSEQSHLLPPVVDGADRVGELSEQVAKKVGLPPRTPVVLAPYDVISTATGVGAVDPGSGFAVLGTTLCLAAPSGGPGLDRSPAGMALAVGSGRWLLAYATLAGTEVLDWWAKTLGHGSAEGLANLAAESTSDNVPLLLPYLSPAGERAPIRDANARGAMVGLNFTHTPADLARATMEGLTMAVLDCFKASEQHLDVLRITGGGSRSDLWTQMLADGLGLPVQRTTGQQTGALGAVLQGQVALGTDEDLTALVAQHVTVDRAFEPEAAASEHLAGAFERFETARRNHVHRS